MCSRWVPPLSTHLAPLGLHIGFPLPPTPHGELEIGPQANLNLLTELSESDSSVMLVKICPATASVSTCRQLAISLFKPF